MVSASSAPLPSTITIPWSGHGSVELRLLYTFPRIWTQEHSRSFGLYWSDELAFGRLHPEPTADELNQFYNFEKYSAYLSGTMKDEKARPSIFSRVLRKLAWRSDQSDPPAAEFLAPRLSGAETVCDIGCGSGALLAHLRPQVQSVTGVDPSDASLGALEKNGIEGFHGTAEALPEALQGRQFDLVTMQQSLEHCLDPALALKNLRSVCTQDGHCLIEVPNHENFGFGKYGPAWYHTDAGRHVHFFTAKSVSELLQHAGFEPVYVGYLSYTRQFGPEWIAAMQEVWDCLYHDAPSTAAAPRPRQSDALRDFLASKQQTKAQNYDVLRVYAKAISDQA